MKRHLLILALFAGTSQAHTDSTPHIDFRDLCPVSSTDCSAIFKTTVEAASAAYKYIYFVNGTYNIKSFNRLLPGVRLNHLDIRGDKWNGPVIKTDNLDFSQIYNASLSNIRIEGPTNNHITTELVRFGVDSNSSTTSVNIDHVIFRNSGEDLVNIVGVNDVTITTSHFENAGFEDTRVKPNDPNDQRPNGNAITLFYVDNGLIQNVYFTKIRRVGVMAEADVNNLTVKSNTFNLKSPSNPTELYGYQGGACFYQTSESNSNIIFEDNECNDFKVNGVRLKGNSMTVVNNHFNHKKGTSCNTSNYTPIQYNPSIKVHKANGPSSYIEGNCIHKSSDGILLQPDSYRSINNLSVINNTIVNSGTGIEISPAPNTNGSYCGLNVENNFFVSSGSYPVYVVDDGDSCSNNIERPIMTR